MPERIQYRRGEKLPPGAKLCARPSRWGNQFRIGDLYAEPDQPMRVPPLPSTELAGQALTEGTGIVREISGIKWIYTVRRVRDRAHAVALFIALAGRVTDDAGLSYREQARRDLAGLDLACYCPLDGQPCHCDALLRWAAGWRAFTPDFAEGSGTRVHMKRACNGCHELIGDVSWEEMEAGMNGDPLPDVRLECPRCAPELAVADATP